MIVPSAWQVRIKSIDEVVPEKGFQFLFQGGEVEVKLRYAFPQLDNSVEIYEIEVVISSSRK